MVRTLYYSSNFENKIDDLDISKKKKIEKGGHPRKTNCIDRHEYQYQTFYRAIIQKKFYFFPLWDQFSEAIRAQNFSTGDATLRITLKRIQSEHFNFTNRSYITARCNSHAAQSSVPVLQLSSTAELRIIFSSQDEKKKRF